MAKYIVKVSGVSHGAGEYDGGDTLKSARKEAAFFVRELPDASVRIVRAVECGERIETVEVIA